MKIKLHRIDDAFHMEASNGENNKINIDASPAKGGKNHGVRPMELLLMSLGGCSAIDVIMILKKQKQDLKDLQIEVEGKREQSGGVALFREIKIHFDFKGDLDKAKVERAISLSLNKYCSVAKTLEQTAKISYSFSIG